MERIRTVHVVNPSGLHARPCHAIVATALRFSAADLRIRSGSRDVNGKSILELMTLNAAQGTELELMAAGDGAGELLEELDALFARGFGERA